MFSFILRTILATLLALSAHSKEKAQGPSSKGYQQIFAGALTYHFFDFKEDSQKFKKNIGDQGKLILHPFLGFEDARIKGEDIETNTYFIFNDSLGSFAYGYQRGSSVFLNKYIEAGYFWGAYFIRQNIWEENEINLPVRIKFGRNIALVPIVGLRQTFNIKISERYDFKFNLAITPNTSTLLLGISRDL